MRRATLPVCLASLLAWGCSQEWPDPPLVSAEALLAEHEAWRANRERRLVTPPGGAVLWTGLWDLPEGEVHFGSDASLPIVLPAEDAPAMAGTLRRTGRVVTLRPAPGAGLRQRTGDPEAVPPTEVPVTSDMVLENDRADSPTTLVLGSLGLRVHAEPGTDRLWLRAWDEDAPVRASFRLPPTTPFVPSGWCRRASSPTTILWACAFRT